MAAKQEVSRSAAFRQGQSRPARLLYSTAVARRRSLGLTQEGLAERVGCDRRSISRLETAAHSPSLDRVLVLADGLGVSLIELFDDFDQAEAAV